MNDLTTYEFFQAKYSNFRQFISELPHPEVGKLSAYLDALPLEEFRAIIMPKLMNAIVLNLDNKEAARNKECERVIVKICDLDSIEISPDNRGKLIRYCILFCVILSEQ